MSNIPENVLETAKILEKETHLGENGVIEVSKDAFEKTLPEELTMETYVAANNHRDVTLAALGKVVGDIGINAMEKDKDLKQVSASMALHKDTLTSTFQRERQVPNSDGGTSTSYGILRSNVQVNGAANKGALKKVKADLSERARDAFAN